jgi:galactose-1-phosphate uridylyltransferase
MRRGGSVLFPNLYPYASFSAVSLIEGEHFVEIGTASASAYADSLFNCLAYLRRVKAHDPAAVFAAVTQNHLPAAGGSLLHPHLQVHADRAASNHHRYYREAAETFHRESRRGLFSAYLEHEEAAGERFIGATGGWQWVAAFAPEGFYELWGILPESRSLACLGEEDAHALARGILCAQRYYRSLHRNAYNLGLLAVESPSSRLELRAVLTVRSNHAPWARNDRSGFEVALGDMATFEPPEEVAAGARPFWA